MYIHIPYPQNHRQTDTQTDCAGMTASESAVPKNTTNTCQEEKENKHDVKKGWGKSRAYSNNYFLRLPEPERRWNSESVCVIMNRGGFEVDVAVSEVHTCYKKEVRNWVSRSVLTSFVFSDLPTQSSNQCNFELTSRRVVYLYPKCSLNWSITLKRCLGLVLSNFDVISLMEPGNMPVM